MGEHRDQTTFVLNFSPASTSPFPPVHYPPYAYGPFFIEHSIEALHELGMASGNVNNFLKCLIDSDWKNKFSFLFRHLMFSLILQNRPILTGQLR